jgi:iron-sulfur cluster assembly protein
MIKVSEKAKQHALDLISDENSPEGTFIRVGGWWRLFRS